MNGHRTHALAVALVAVLVGLAGCSALTGGGETPTPDEPTPTDAATPSGAASNATGDASNATGDPSTATGDQSNATGTSPKTTDGPSDGADEASGPTDEQSSPADNASITVLNGTLSHDPGAVYRDLQALRETSQAAPSTIQLHNLTAIEANATDASEIDQYNRLFAYLNVTTGRMNDTGEPWPPFNGGVHPSGSVDLSLREETDTATERIALAHELVHYIQVQSGQWDRQAAPIDLTTRDGTYAALSVREGDAVFTTDAYLANATETEQRNAPVYERAHDRLPPGHLARYENSWYRNGLDYVRAFVDHPRAVGQLYESPPTTSEQILHQLPPDAEPPSPLPIERAVGGDWHHAGSDRLGEVFVRHALASEVGLDRARTAATGWGNDSLEIYRSAEHEEPGYAWILRWDDEANATAFEDAMTETLDELGREAEGTWTLATQDEVSRLERPDERTVVLLVGAEPFVAATSVERADGTVRLAAE